MSGIPLRSPATGADTAASRAHSTRRAGCRRLRLVFAMVLVCALLQGCDSRSDGGRPGKAPATSSRVAHEPTVDDGLSPSYEPNAPVRSVVGRGHVLTGTVVSSRDGRPIAHAKLELWPEYAGSGHPAEARATVFTDRSGGYRYECDPPEHIHMRISAPQYVTIGQNSYHPAGAPRGEFDIVLQPE